MIFFRRCFGLLQSLPLRRRLVPSPTWLTRLSRNLLIDPVPAVPGRSGSTEPKSKISSPRCEEKGGMARSTACAGDRLLSGNGKPAKVAYSARWRSYRGNCGRR